MAKSGREIMEILEAYDLTRCAHSAAPLAGVDEKTVARYVAIRDSGRDPLTATRRARAIDPFLDKIEELVDKSEGKIRADVVHQRLVAMGFRGGDRSTRRAVAEAKEAWKPGHRRKYRPWIPEPGMWLQFDWGEGLRIGGVERSCFARGWRGAVSRGAARVGSDAGQLGGLPGRHAAPAGWRADLCADRQPENGDDRPGRRETAAAPIDRLRAERQHLHVLPVESHAIALGAERLVEPDQTIRFESVRYSTPDGQQGSKVWCRVVGEELVIVGRAAAGLAEIARHELSTPGTPRILDEHYPHHPGGNLPRPPKVRPRPRAGRGPRPRPGR